jgi:MFS family permease
MQSDAPSGLPAAPSPFAADRNAVLFVAFRILFHSRFYYPVFMILFLDFGITVEEFGLLNAVWAAAIVLLEVPSGALADLVGRRRLLVAGSLLMVLEMLVLCVVPVPSAWVLPALLANRVLSGAAEAFISGADEALAYDSLRAHGLAEQWPRVLERLLQWGGVATVVAMITGSLLYDPATLNALGRSLGGAGALTAADTFRLPVWLTLASSVVAVGVALAMREPARVAPRDAAGAVPVGLLAPFRQTWTTVRWVLTHPVVLVVILAGVLIDQPIRQVLVVSSEVYRQIGIPERLFGFISAGSAVVGLLTAAPMRRLALRRTPRFNFFLLAAVALAGLAGVAALVPWWGVVFVMLLSNALRLVIFLQSHYLNQVVDSDRRATVLSVRGLAVNVAYGLMSMAFAAAVAAADRLSAADDQEGFRTAVGLLPWFFAAACLAFLFWSRGRVTAGAVAVPGGFTVQRDATATRTRPSQPEVEGDGTEQHDTDDGVGGEEGVVHP